MTLSTLAQVVGTVGVLTISIGFLLAQVVSAEVSLRSSLGLARHPLFVLSLALVLASLMLDFAILSRVDALVVGSPTNSWPIDMALVLALAGVAGTGLFIWNAPRLLSPEELVRQVLRRFSSRWAELVKQDWGNGSGPVYLDDPLVVLERILSRSVERQDAFTIRSTVHLLASRLETYFPRAPDRNVPEPGGHFENWQEPARPNAVKLDSYVFGPLKGVVNQAAAARYGEALLYFVEFWRRIGPPDPAEQVAAMRSARFDPWPERTTPGERLLRHVVGKALEFGIVDVAREGLYEIARYGRSFARILPAANDTYSLLRESWPSSARYAPENSLDEREKSRRQENDHTVWSFNEHYPGYFGHVASLAIEKRLWDILWLASSSLADIPATVFEANPDRPIRAAVLRTCLSDLRLVSQDLCRLPATEKLNIFDSLGLSVSGLDNVVKLMDVETDGDLAQDIAITLDHLLESQFYAGVLSSSLVRKAGDIASEMGSVFRDAQFRVIDVLGKLAGEVQAEGWTTSDPNRRALYQSLLLALDRQRSTSSSSPEAARRALEKKMEALLKGLNETDFSPWAQTLPNERPPRKVGRQHRSSAETKRHRDAAERG